MKLEVAPIRITPEAFERTIKGILEGSGIPLKSYSTMHYKQAEVYSDEYLIEFIATFQVLHDEHSVLVSCQHQEQETTHAAIDALHASMKCHQVKRAILVSVLGFERDVIRHAEVCGVALIQLASANSSWHLDYSKHSMPDLFLADAHKYVGWCCHENYLSLMSEEINAHTAKALGLDDL